MNLTKGYLKQLIAESVNELYSARQGLKSQQRRSNVGDALKISGEEIEKLTIPRDQATEIAIFLHRLGVSSEKLNLTFMQMLQQELQGVEDKVSAGGPPSSGPQLQPPTTSAEQMNEEAWQEKDFKTRIKGVDGNKSRRTTMSRGGKDPFSSKAVEKNKGYVAPVEVGEKYKKVKKGDTTTVYDDRTFNTSGAAKKLSGQNWKGTVVDKDTDGTTKKAKFVQPVDDRAPTSVGMAESQLKQMIEEELINILMESEKHYV